MRDQGPHKEAGQKAKFRLGGVVLGYVILAGLWIVFSDLALEGVWPDGRGQVTASILKGLAFVAITAALLALLLRRERSRFYRNVARQVASMAALLEHFRALSERVSDIVLLVDEQDRIIEANEAAVEALGWPRSALCNRTINDLEVGMAASHAAARPTSYEAMFRLANGRLLPVEVDQLSLRMGSRELRQFIVRSATDRERTVAGHRDRSWIDVFFDMPFIGMAITSPQTRRWVRFNDHLCTILGYSRAELGELNWAEITHPEDLDKDVEKFERVLNGEIDSYRLEKRFVRKDGSVIQAEIDVRCRRLPDGTADYLVCTVRDDSERFKAEDRLRRQKDLYAALSRVNMAITRLPRQEQIFQEVCDAVVGIGRFNFAWVIEVGEQIEDYRFGAVAGDDKGFVRAVMDLAKPASDLEKTAPAKAVRSARPVVSDPYMEDPGTEPWRDLAARANVAASGAFPIRDGIRVVAVLNVYSDRCGDFDTDVIRLIEEMTRDVSFAIQNRHREEARVASLRALEAAEARSRFALEAAGHGAWEWDVSTDRVNYAPQWKAMLGFAEHEISDSPDEWRSRIHPEDREQALASIQEHLQGKTPSFVSEHRLRCKDGSYKWVLDRGQVLERAPGGQPLKVFGTKTDLTVVKSAEEALRQERLRMDLARVSARIGTWDYDIATATVHLHRHTPALFGLGEDPRSMPLDEYLHLVHPEDRATFAAVVERHLRDGGDYVSEFRFVWPDGSVRWIEDRGLLYYDEQGTPVSAFGISVDVTERIKAEQSIQEYVTRLERAMLGTVDAISHMVDLRDPYTAGHEVRVGELAEAIGRELGLDSATCQGLQIIGRVHDIGKITIPAEILSKPGRLSELEMNIVRTHAQQGYEILKDVDFDWPVAEVILQHHERMDGSGYPRGLRGDAILLEARIIAVADVVESMASHRPYRAALGIGPALAEVEGNSGVLYDPEVVAACLRLFREQAFSFDAPEEGPLRAG